jgi:hypothetical protein
MPWPFSMFLYESPWLSPLGALGKDRQGRRS